MKSKETGNGNGMKRKWMKGRITRIKHREISVPSAARFYGRQSMTRRSRANERTNKPDICDAYTMIHGLVPIKSLLYGRSLIPEARFFFAYGCASPLDRARQCSSMGVQRNALF